MTFYPRFQTFLIFDDSRLGVIIPLTTIIAPMLAQAIRNLRSGEISLICYKGRSPSPNSSVQLDTRFGKPTDSVAGTYSLTKIGRTLHQDETCIFIYYPVKGISESSGL